MVAVHPPSLHSAARSEYLSRLNSCAACIPSSHGTVSSIMRALAAVAHTRASGLNVVWVISVGKISWVPRSTRISQQTCVLPPLSSCPPSPGLRNGTFGVKGNRQSYLLSTLLRQLPQHLIMPPPKATLRQCNVTPPDRICWRPALALLHRGNLSSLPNHRERFRGQGRVSYDCPHEEAEPWRRSSPDICQVMSLLLMSSQRVHAPCLHWETAWWGNGPCSTCETSSTTMDFLCSLVALDQNWTGSPRIGGFLLNVSPKSSQLKEPKT